MTLITSKICKSVDIFYFVCSRQRYVLGDDAMKLLSQSSIYLYGIKGLGVEIGNFTKLIRCNINLDV